MATVHVEGLTKDFGSTRVVDDVGFTASHGRITGLLGPNGSGKSTTLRMMLGLVLGDGSATVDGVELHRLPDRASRVGALLDDRGFHPRRSGRQHLRMLAAATHTSDRRVDAMLDRVGLTGAADRPVRTFSLGMRQRLGLASALLTDPEILLLDEPSNGLDPLGLAWLRRALAELAGNGVTVVIASHFLAEVHEIIDDVVVIDHGRVVVESPVGDFVRRFASEEVVVSTDDLAALAGALRRSGAEVDAYRAHLRVTGLPRDQVGRIAHDLGAVVTELSATTTTLEAAYVLACHGPQHTMDREAPRGTAAPVLSAMTSAMTSVGR